MQFTGRPNDVRWHCQNGTWNVPTGNAGLLDIVMIDTNPFMPHYLNEAWSKNAGGRGAIAMFVLLFVTGARVALVQSVGCITMLGLTASMQ